MHRLLPTGLETLTSAFAIIPIFLYYRKTRFQNWNITTGYTIFALYLCAIYAVAGLPNIFYLRFCLRMNIIPFAYMFSDRESSILNILLFVPMGILLPVLWSRFHNLFKTLLFGFSISLFVELMQIFTLRATDINDLITNTSGTLAGYVIGLLILKCMPQIYADGNTKDIPLVLATTFFVMYFIHPILSLLLWRILF